jgi:DNA polymerase
MKALAWSTGTINPVEYQRLCQYCCDDVLTERDVDLKLPDLPEKEQKIWSLDQYINDTGVMVDMDATAKAAEAVTKETGILTEELTLLTGGEIEAGTQRDAIKKWLEKRGCEMKDMTKASVKEALTKTSGVELRVLQLRKALSQSSNAKYAALLGFTSPDGRIRDTLVYHGASTGRWSGKAVQLHNLPKPKFDHFDNTVPINILKAGGHAALSQMYEYETLEVLSSCIRGMFVPTPGYEMFVTDFAAIEARLVMWLAGEQVGVDMFTAQDKDPNIPDIYVMMARQIYKNNTITKKNKTERQLGKQAILASGYGMGQPRFITTCESYGIPCTEELAAKAVQGYRSMFRRVVQFWYDTETEAKKAVLTPGKSFQVGKVLWYLDGEFLRCKLPSGRTLAYHYPTVENGELKFWAVNSVTKKYWQEHTWGGTLVENCTSAIARDIMVESMLQFASQGFRILFTVHDELVLEALAGTKTTEDVLRIVRTVPSWAVGCPINADCDRKERYAK